MQQVKFYPILLLCLLAFAQNVQAQANLSVQGTIQKPTGAAVEDGGYDILFKLYTVETAGTAVWNETQTVQVVNGVYSVLLGAVNPLTATFDVPYFLGITLPGAPELTPRSPLTSSPYALSVIGQDNRFPSTGNVGIGTVAPHANHDVNGSIATGQTTTTATTYSVDADDHVIFLDNTANQNVTLPAASVANARRHLVLVNKAATAKTLTASSYLDITNATSTTVPARSAIELQSDGAVWRQTGGYVTPGAPEKAYVLASGTGISMGASTTTNISWNELTDTGNNFNGTTFTAPRTGMYHVSGRLFADHATGACLVTVHCQGTLQQSGQYIGYNYFPSGQMTLGFQSDVYMVVGQTLYINSYNNYGANIQLTTSVTSTYLTISEY